jgi:CheY-like chemotaxis protein
MDGLEVLDHIRADLEIKHTLVVLVTARAQAADYNEGQLRGADAYFIKPFIPTELISWLRKRLQ